MPKRKSTTSLINNNKPKSLRHKREAAPSTRKTRSSSRRRTRASASLSSLETKKASMDKYSTSIDSNYVDPDIDLNSVMTLSDDNRAVVATTQMEKSVGFQENASRSNSKKLVRRRRSAKSDISKCSSTSLIKKSTFQTKSKNKALKGSLSQKCSRDHIERKYSEQELLAIRQKNKKKVNSTLGNARFIKMAFWRTLFPHLQGCGWVKVQQMSFNDDFGTYYFVPPGVSIEWLSSIVDVVCHVSSNNTYRGAYELYLKDLHLLRNLKRVPSYRRAFAFSQSIFTKKSSRVGEHIQVSRLPEPSTAQKLYR